jgi:hypothetical protein
MMLYVECTRVNMTFLSPLLVIDRRGVSVISRVFPTVGWHTYGYTALWNQFRIIGNKKEYTRKVLGEIGNVWYKKEYTRKVLGELKNVWYKKEYTHPIP